MQVVRCVVGGCGFTLLLFHDLFCKCYLFVGAPLADLGSSFVPVGMRHINCGWNPLKVFGSLSKDTNVLRFWWSKRINSWFWAKGGNDVRLKAKRSLLLNPSCQSYWEILSFLLWKHKSLVASSCSIWWIVEIRSSSRNAHCRIRGLSNFVTIRNINSSWSLTHFILIFNQSLKSLAVLVASTFLIGYLVLKIMMPTISTAKATRQSG